MAVGDNRGILRVGIEIGGSVGRSLDAAIRQTRAKIGGLGTALNDVAGSGRRGLRDTLGAPLWQGAAAGAGVLTLGLAASTRQAIDFESSLADVRKVVAGMDDPKQFAAMRQNILAMSREIPITASGLASMFAAAGQAGIANKDLDRFVRSAARMGIAFDMTADQAGEAMAKLRTGMGLTQDQVENLGDAVNHLSNSSASRANEIVDFLQRVGSERRRIAMTGEQIASLGSAMIATGAAPEVAATSFRNMVRALTMGEAATKRQSKAFQALGLDSREVAKRMQQDGAGTVLDVFRRIQNLPAEKRNSLSSMLFGDEARALTPLLANYEAVEKAFKAVGDQSLYAGSMLREYEVRSKTSANELQLLQNNLQALAITVGSAVLPSLNRLAKIAAPLLANVAKWAEENPKLTTGIVALGAAFIAFVAVAPAVASALGLISGAGKVLAGLKLGATLAGWLPAILGTGKALLVLATGPVGLTVAAVLALGAVLLWAWGRFDWLRQGALTALDGISDGWKAGWDLLKGIAMGDSQLIGDAFGRLMGALGQAAGAGFNLIRRGATDLIGWLLQQLAQLPGRILKSAMAVGEAYSRGVQSGATRLWNWVSGAGDGPANNIRPIPRARGGRVRPGQAYLVGERRPEVVEFGGSGYVHPSVGAYAGQGGGPAVQLTVQPGAVVIHAAGADSDQLQRAIQDAFTQLRYELESSYRSMLSD
ncbi:phage tail tape measure protein [Cyanobium sp. N5-Cardenillas]|uniref:phage tail tape measure protein n=1 Tax=Cyanobium sp. N5-Cardenillas TaxID=2823720 RepID=UPI0020CF015A|nr:phage tail tape measure protein [Cyanobium sp. N5-Cardenillas]MCP9785397.1 phage tail tape measure protein [Cyanobium sp. N5-Cardenillas]